MSGESTSALVSGFVFGAITFQHLNAGADSEGFLLGAVKGEAKDSITDSQMSDVQVVFTIDIQRHLPSHHLCRFYDGAGGLRTQTLQELLAGQDKDVIGWYKFRHNTEQSVSFRERILHRNLQARLSSPELVFLLVTSQSTTESRSTHLMEYGLYKPQHGPLQKVPLVITNVGLSEQQGYSTLLGSCASAGFHRAVTSHRSEFFNEDGALKEVDKITALCGALQEELQETCSRVAESEGAVGSLLQQVKQLKERIAEKRRRHKNGKTLPARAEENLFLCQALRHFFPHSAVLQSSSLALSGEPVPLTRRCDLNDLYDLKNLTLILQPSDLPAAPAHKPCKRKRPAPKRKGGLPRMTTRGAAQRDGGANDRTAFSSGTETDDSQQLRTDWTGTRSPTF